MIKFKVKIIVPEKEIGKKIQNAIDKAQMVLDTQVLKDSNNFIPMDTHNLEMSGVRDSRIGEGLISWNTPYARRLYYNPQYEFSKDQNPQAQGLWFEAAKAIKKEEWAKAAQKEFDDNF